MATWATVQGEIEAAMVAAGYTAAASPGGLLAQGESAFDARYDLHDPVVRPTQTMQGPTITEGETTFNVRLGHRVKGATKDAWKTSRKIHIDRCHAVQSLLLNKDANVPSAVGVFSAGDARIVEGEPYETTAYSVIPFRVRWRA